MNTKQLLDTADALLSQDTWRHNILDLGVTEQAIIDHARYLAHIIEGLLGRNRCGDAALMACNIADLLRMQSRLARRIDDLRAAAA